MASRYSLKPFRVPDETPLCDRVAMINDLANEGMQYQTVRMLARMVVDQSKKRIRQFSVLAAKDPNVQRAMRVQQWVNRIVALEALRCVQSLPYTHNPKDQDWLQSADWTVRNGGDCKDLTILLVAIDRLLGLSADPFWIVQTGQSINHVTGKVILDGQPFWQDASMRGAMLGESPYEAEPRLDAADVTGRSLSAGQAKGQFADARRFPFTWSGWDELWPGWPPSWWCGSYQYLCQPYQLVRAHPEFYGFYRLSKPYVSFDGIPLGS